MKKSRLITGYLAIVSLAIILKLFAYRPEETMIRGFNEPSPSLQDVSVRQNDPERDGVDVDSIKQRSIHKGCSGRKVYKYRKP